MPAVNGLSQKEQVFVREYTRDFNATRAAIAAGYSPKSAAVTGHRLAKKSQVAAAIEKRKARFAAKADITQQEIIDLLAARARARLSDVAEWDADSLTLYPSDEVDDTALKAMAVTKVVTVTTRTSKDGAVTVNETTATRTKVELDDRVKAAELLGRHLGMWPKDGPTGGEGEPAKAYSQEDWDRIP